MKRSLIPMILGLIAGCSEELGPVALETTRVTGVVFEGSQPVRGGFIEFVPVDGTVGNMHSAPIRSDGTFAIDGVAVGENRIGLVNVSGSLPRGTLSQFDTLRTQIRRKVPPGPSSSVTINLYEEIVRLQNERAAAAK